MSSNAVKFVRVLNGQTVCLSINNLEQIFKIARISAMIEPAADYVEDMLSHYVFRIEMVKDDLIEIFFTAQGQEFNLSDQMIFIGLAFPTFP